MSAGMTIAGSGTAASAATAASSTAAAGTTTSTAVGATTGGSGQPGAGALEGGGMVAYVAPGWLVGGLNACLMRFRAVSFDADGTLLHFNPAIRRELEEDLAYPAARAVSPSSASASCATVVGERAGMEQAAIRRESFGRALADLGVDDGPIVLELTTQSWRQFSP